MRPASWWLTEYARTHQNPLNKRIHFICVPAIFWSIVALLCALPNPAFADGIFFWPLVAWTASGFFYLGLGVRYFTEMFIVFCLALLLTFAVERVGLPLGWTAVIVFVVAWIGQFYGHQVEGKKPSFFEDLLFLLIGPLWIVERILKRA